MEAILCAAIASTIGLSLASYTSYAKTAKNGNGNGSAVVVTSNGRLPVLTPGPQKIVIRDTNPLSVFTSGLITTTGPTRIRVGTVSSKLRYNIGRRINSSFQ